MGRRADFEILVRDAPSRIVSPVLRGLAPREALERLARAHGLSVIEIASRRFVLVRRPPTPDANTSAPMLLESAGADVIVQARRIDEAREDVPVALSVLAPADLLERQVRRLDDLTGTVPGLIVTSQTSGTTPLFSAR